MSLVAEEEFRINEERASLKRFKCPCCGNYTFVEKPNGNYDICPVCFWEDDPDAYDDIYETWCCNGVSLFQARKNYNEFGACEKSMLVHTRKPYKEELPENNIKP